jgi:uncharacterized surface protein with fasciclin (FAS1) repeats
LARTEFGVAVASILVVAGVLAVPLVAPMPTAAPTIAPHPFVTPSASATPNPAALVGPGCKAFMAKVPTGPGSITGMAQDLVTVAASNNPDLSEFTAAISGKLNPDVDLVAKLGVGKYTVFAPIDSAFAKLSAATMSSLKLPANEKQLTNILDFHVVKGELDPTNVDGILPTLEGGMLTVKGSGNSITVNGANVVCGGIQTANATVYLIDTVLMPPANQ